MTEHPRRVPRSRRARRRRAGAPEAAIARPRTPGASCAATRCSGSPSALITIFVLMAVFPRLFTRRTRPRYPGQVASERPDSQRGSGATSRATTSTPASSTAPRVDPRRGDRDHARAPSDRRPARRHSRLLRRLGRLADLAHRGRLLRDPAAPGRASSSWSPSRPTTTRPTRRLARWCSRWSSWAGRALPGSCARASCRSSQRLRAGRPRARCEPAADRSARTSSPTPLAPVDRGRDDQPRRLHLGRGDPVLPRDRPAAAGHLLGHRHHAAPVVACAPPRTCCSSPALPSRLTVLAFIMLGDVVVTPSTRRTAEPDGGTVTTDETTTWPSPWSRARRPGPSASTPSRQDGASLLEVEDLFVEFHTATAWPRRSTACRSTCTRARRSRSSASPGRASP